MTKTLPNLRNEIERGPQAVPRTDPHAIKYGKTRENTKEFATRIALLMAEECAGICEQRSGGWPNVANELAQAIRAFAATLTPGQEEK